MLSLLHRTMVRQIQGESAVSRVSKGQCFGEAGPLGLPPANQFQTDINGVRLSPSGLAAQSAQNDDGVTLIRPASTSATTMKG